MINSNRWRFQSVQIMLVLIGFAIIYRIVNVQISPEAQAYLIGSELNLKTISPPRGEIYDRNGNLLAGNITVYEIGLDLNTFRATNNADAIALALSVNAGLDYAEIYAKINSVSDPNQNYLVLKDYVSSEAVDKLTAYITKLESDPNSPNQSVLDGLAFKAHYQRYYPENSLASNLIGFVTLDNNGYFGVEEEYNNLLAGIPSIVWVPINPTRVEEVPQVEPSTTLILTLDREIQSAMENILDSSLNESGAESGTIVVMDPKNGEILAMASTPRMDLNDYTNYANVFPGSTPFNRAVSQAYEPGSVLKILTLSAAIDTNVVQPTTGYWDYGSIFYGGVSFTNWDQGAYGPQDMLGCIQHSLNVCFVWIATQVGTDNFYDYMNKFGLGHTTGIDLAGEATGRLKLPGDADWYPVDLATNSFGQGLSVTPIQMVMAASAIANNGKMVQPHILYSTVDDGAQQNKNYEYAGNPISAQTAQTMNELLAVSLENEASQALVPGYRVAGKTGTAQIPVFGGYDESSTNASFIGWGPVDDPKFMVYIWLEKPKSSIWSSEVAAPVFKQVVEKLVVLMGIPPDSIRLQMAGQ
jgi:cell division protein FtsI/penicillin-binding protein 2